MKPKLTNKMFQKSLQARLREIKCGEPFSFDESYSLVVAKCDSYTVAELEQMMAGVGFRGLSIAEGICRKNGNKCPKVKSLTIKIKNSTCVTDTGGKHIWTIFATVTTKCT